MGHIYAVVITENGPAKRAAINYNPKESGMVDCYAAVGLKGGHGMPDMSMDMSEAMAASSSNSAGIRSTFVVVMVTLAAAVLC
jgi:hypothetical protein